MKAQGELTEIRFMLHALELGLTVSKPWGDNAKYDFIIDSGTKLHRIQVKSTQAFDSANAGTGRYTIGSRSGSARTQAYLASDIDYLVAYVIPCLTWYVIPVSALGGRLTLKLYPHRDGSIGQFEQYRDAWVLLTA